ncbi:MAG: UvrD-helicase domain-containing protein [Oscillospiraceae bacterium]|jgi:DNA helicase-2/ATP-dependent DNA helicase PcrA|nr:UvrD-helicase domain-containing protein [Oscillospiraceae bacterium]
MVEKFKSIKKAFLEREFSEMNERQLEAVFYTEGQLMVLAGAGSGKTAMLVNRVANLIDYGDLYHSDFVPSNLSEDLILRLESAFSEGKNLSYFKDVLNFNGVNPQNILAITFTNKAAREMKERLVSRLGEEKSSWVFASTFHSLCAKILRENAERLGYPEDFVIYDIDDTKRLIKDCQKMLSVDEKVFSVKSTASSISKAKDEILTPNEFKMRHENDFRLSSVGEIYDLYQKRLKAAGAMDFDDLIFNTLELFSKYPEVRQSYSERFHYVLVDEYQDTNMAQHLFIQKLVDKKDGNLCIVGDDDQSIYKFRGATVENILGFDKVYKKAKIIRLEQNYRSTKNILSAANSIIEHNANRKGKRLWTNNLEGKRIRVHTAYSEHNEAVFISDELKSRIGAGCSASDFAVLYRASSQSGVIERLLARAGLPYRVVGGIRFYDHREVKDLISYLSVVNNPLDEVRLKRIINQPKRTIGERTINQVISIASDEGKPLFEVMRNANFYEDLRRSAVKLMDFAQTIEHFISFHKSGVKLSELYKEILEKTGYIDFLKSKEEDADSRIANVQELGNAIKRFEEENSGAINLSSFLEDVSLISEAETSNSDGAINLMTVHASKGLEFPVVFLPGFEEGIFPGIQCIFNPEEVEEERRLAYVAITRAKEELFIINSTSRMIYGSTSHNKASRFLSEIPEELLERTKSRDWAKIPAEGGTVSSAYDLRVKSVVSARNFGQSPVSVIEEKTGETERFVPGDLVSHSVFGRGKVVSSVSMGDDALLEINFSGIGNKKMMSQFAKLKRELDLC